MSVGDELKKLGLKKAYYYLDKDPDANLPKLMEWLDHFVGDNKVMVEQRMAFKRVIQEKDSNWYKLIESVWTDIDDDVRKTLFENMVINGNAIAGPKAKRNMAEYGCYIPWAIIFQMSENPDENLSFDEMDSLIEQAKELGTFIYVFSGGDPLYDSDELIAICNKHSDCEFMVFTSGLGIDDELAVQMKRVRNIVPAIRITGSARDKAAEEPMRILKANKLPFGNFINYDVNTVDNFRHESFFDDMIESGSKFCWFFTPLTGDADTLYPMIVDYRQSKPLLTISYCRDTGIMGGCTAGGKRFCVIDANGDVEPCTFMHVSDTNVKDGKSTLLDAYRSPLFMTYYRGEAECSRMCKNK